MNNNSLAKHIAQNLESKSGSHSPQKRKSQRASAGEEAGASDLIQLLKSLLPMATKLDIAAQRFLDDPSNQLLLSDDDVDCLQRLCSFHEDVADSIAIVTEATS